MESKLSFTIPSIHDDTVLDCRLYYSTAHDKTASHAYRARGAIIAHPYAPLGGCYDDPIVGLLISEISKLSFGFICTFNFRGAYGSAGHTSWTGKAEKCDYESVVGFMLEYLRHCERPIDEGSDDAAEMRIQLILGGYSYGSWICSHLPTPTEIWKAFEVAPDGSASAEIKARAQHLATQTNLEIRSAWLESSGRHSHTLSVGGEETSPEKRHRCGENSPSRFSSDVRKSFDFARKLGSLKKKHHDTSSPVTEDLTADHASVNLDAPSEPNVAVSYILVSPLLPPVSIFTTIPFGSNALRAHTEADLHKLSANPTLAVFGSDDMFTSGKKLRAWAQDISGKPSSQFRFVEVDGAGHFWRSHSAQKALKIAVKQWFQNLPNGTTVPDGPTPIPDERGSTVHGEDAGSDVFK